MKSLRLFLKGVQFNSVIGLKLRPMSCDIMGAADDLLTHTDPD